MDIRSLLNKLDRVELSEAITIKDVEAAVAGKTDEQERANILNDIAWKEKLPGLYDPVSGYFVPKQGQPNSMGGKYNIAATASTSADKALADLGLVPQNAKTSTGLGRMFRGDDKGQHDADTKGASDKVNKDRQTGEIKADKLPKLKALVDKLKAASGGASSSTASTGTGLKMPGMTNKAPSVGGLKIAEGSIFESLLKEFQDEIIDQGIEEADPAIPGIQGGTGTLPAPKTSPAPAGKNKDLVMQIQALVDELSTIEGDKDIEAAVADAQAAIQADAEAEKTAGAASASAKEAKVNRLKELLAKAKEGKAPTATNAASLKTAQTAAAPKTESMSELIARISSIAEGTNVLAEALTADEYKELQKLAAELQSEYADDQELQTLAKQALDLPAQFGSDPAATAATDKPGEKPGEKKPGVADPAIQKVQEQLKALGVDPGPIDGKMGPKTIAGIKAFEKMAGKPETGKVTPELTALLADGKNVVARSQLTQSLTAIEAIVTKYKISESVTEEDVLAMTESEARVFVMKNLKYFSEAEQIAITRDYLSEAPVPALASPGGNLPAVAGKPPGNPNVIDVPFRDVTPKPSWGQRALNVFKGAGKKVALGATAVGAVLGLGALWKAFSGGDIEMDPKDLAELQKHLKVLDQYGQDPAIKAGLPADVQKRLDVVIAKLDKLKKAKAAGGAPASAPAKPAAPGAPAAGNISNTPAA